MQDNKQQTQLKAFQAARTRQASETPLHFFHALSQLLTEIPSLQLKKIRWLNPMNQPPSLIVTFEPSSSLPVAKEQIITAILSTHKLAAGSPLSSSVPWVLTPLQ